MRSADGLDACFALSTAWPYAASGRARAAAARPHVARNERRPVVVAFIALSSRYLISKMNTRPPAPGAGPSCTVPAGTKTAFGVLAGVDPSKISSTAFLTWRCRGAAVPGGMAHASVRLFFHDGGAEDLVQAVRRLLDIGARQPASSLP